MKTSSIEILDPESGLFVSLTSGGNGAIMLGEDVVAAAPIPVGGLDPLVDGAPLELETEHGDLAVSITSTGEPIRLDGDLIGRREASLIETRGRLTHHGEEINLECRGVLHRRDEDTDLTGRLTRDLTVILADGGLICLTAAAPGSAVNHGDEEAVAAITHPGGYVAFGDVLLSTEYDSAGRQRRATIEMWPATDEIAALHGAGSVVSGCTARIEGATVNTALFRWSLDGHLGLGRYETTRPAGPPA
ncbi:MAG: hypothetical protein KDB48_08290 [Solirubrobacterales bacterium]|nr:hypothetical protein [Solirubrobacterales bacterium]HMT05226.1 hypothetical protein [Solirubrobacterales bacterium]